MSLIVVLSFWQLASIFFFAIGESLSDLAGLSWSWIMVMLLKFIICYLAGLSYSFSFSEVFSLVHFRVRKV